MHETGRNRRGYDVVILTARDLVRDAPQPVYLARALTQLGLRVVLISRAPRDKCIELRREGVHAVSTAISVPHTGLALSAGTALRYLLRCRIAISFELEPLTAIALATPFHRFVRVLYSLELFDSTWVRHRRMATRLGYRALRSLVPPDALVDVCPERLERIRHECGDPSTCFVVRNTPPREAWISARPKPRHGPVRLVYAGDILEHGRAGLELLIEGMARSQAACNLTIYPVRTEARDLESFAALISRYNLGARVHIGPTHGRDELAAALAEHDVGVVFYPVSSTQLANNVLAAPNKLSEYLSAGLAVLATSNPTLQFVQAEGLGWNLPEDNARMVARALNAISVSERKMLEECRQRAHAAFLDRYHFEAQAAPLLRWIEHTVCAEAESSASLGLET